MASLKEVSTDRAPAAIGPYAQGIVAEGWIFTSGQIPVHPETGKVVSTDIQAQTRQVFRNLEAVLVASGGGLSTIVKTTVYLSDMENFQAMNQVYAECLGEHRPARSTVEVARLPKDVGVEIDAVARLDAGA